MRLVLNAQLANHPRHILPRSLSSTPRTHSATEPLSDLYAWPPEGKTFVFVVDCKPLQQSTCGHTVLLNNALVPIWGWATCIGIHRISAMDQEFSTPKNWIIPLKNCFFRLNPLDFSGFFRRSFCEGRELWRLKSDHVHSAFSCFFPF